MTTPYPIVFFPGVMGSRLYFPQADRMWDPDSWGMAWWLPAWPFRSDDDNRRTLHARAEAHVLLDPLDATSMDADQVNLGWGGVVWSFYGEYLKCLQSLALQGRAFAVGYDWRQDIRWLGQFAAEKIWTALDVTGADKVLLVGHSMGCLVVRAALRFDAELQSRVAGVLAICPPASGAVVLYRRLFTGLVASLDEGWGFRRVLGTTRGAFVGNLSGLPGPMQLLPSPHFPPDASGNHWHDALDRGVAAELMYSSPQCPPGINDPTMRLAAEVRADFRQRIDDVKDFHEWLGSPHSDPALPTWLILGTGRDTETRIRFDGKKPKPDLSPDGDGTVPMVSATSMGLGPESVFSYVGIKHDEACKKAEVQDRTKALFEALANS